MKIYKAILILALLAIPGLSNAETVDRLPKINSFAIHHGESNQLFAATQGGVYNSTDNGLTWTFSGT